MFSLLPLLIPLALSGDLGDLDALDGWGERGWGSPPSAELVAVGRDEALVYYSLPGEKTWQFGDHEVSDLVLGYADDQLVAFRFELSRGLAKVARLRFGSASRTGVGERYWIGDRVKLTVEGPVATFTYTESLGAGATLSTVMSNAVSDGATEKGTLDYLDTRPGWRDLAWGGPPADGMERVDGGAGDEAYYVRDTDKLAAGDYALSNIGYGYFKTQLFSVMLMIPDYESARGIRAALVEAYGPPTAEGDGRAVWQGKRVDLSLSLDAETEQGAVIYFYVPLRDLLQAAEDEAARQAADDL